jgi:hypothetical protein
MKFLKLVMAMILFLFFVLKIGQRWDQTRQTQALPIDNSIEVLSEFCCHIIFQEFKADG